MNFNNQKRCIYLDTSFGSFYKFNDMNNVDHTVIDSSQSMGEQKSYYDRYNVKLIHHPNETYGRRLRVITKHLREDYFVYLPDDFRWIFNYPISEAITQAKKHNVQMIKLGPRGMKWFAEREPSNPEPWFHGNQVVSGERLTRKDDLFVSSRWWYRDFHEQFSLGCCIFQSEFANKIFNRISEKCLTPGQCEKSAYIKLLFRPYDVAYYKMWTPAFHFIDLNIEGRNKYTEVRAADQLIEENIDRYNKLFHQ